MTKYELARKMLDAIPVFADSLRDFYRAHGGKSFPDAPIEAEKAAYVDSGSVDLAYDHPAFLAECAGDNMVAFHKTMVEPVALVGPWVCVRAAFETSAFAAWLADPGITVTERVTRSFSFRHKSFDEQVKFLRSRNAPPTQIQTVVQRMQHAEEEARKQKLRILKDKNHRTIGLGMQLPTATTLVVEIFKDEPSYRLLSGMTHGYPWVHGLIIKPDKNDDGVSPRVAVTREMPSVNVGYLCARAVRAYSRAVWYRSQQLGWDLEQLKQILEHTFDSMQIVAKERFWR
jgi:hypothetical protein